MTAPTLFDALQEHPEPFRPRQHNWCRQDEQILHLWRIHGVPADLSTVQTAITLLFALHAEHRALFDALFGGEE